MKNSITPEECFKNKEKYVILDLRTDEEYAGGHIKDAVQIDVRKEENKQVIENLDKGKSYAVYCHGGGRANRTAKFMRESGFTVCVIENSMNGWEEAKLPIEK